MLKFAPVSTLISLLLLISGGDAADAPNFPDNLGKEFVMVFLENGYFSKNTASLELVLFITNPNDSPVTVEIETPKFIKNGNSYVKKSVTVEPNNVTSVELPADLRVVGSVSKSKKAVVVKAPKQVGIYGSNQEEFSTGAFVGFPVDVLGKEYYAVSWTEAHYKSQIGLVATEDGTNIDITVGPNGKTDFEGKTYEAGTKLRSVSLDKYESMQLQSTDKEDLTGTLISSTKPIAAFSGNKKVNIMTEKGPYDHIVEQLMAVNTWGTDFITVPIAGRTTGDAFRFIASADSTNITITGNNDKPETITIDKAGGSKMKLIQKGTYVTATKPIMVAQFSLSQGANKFGTNTASSEAADPSMLILPPIQQFSSDYIFSTLSLKRKGVTSEYMNKLMLAIQDEDKDGILFDGKLLKSVTWEKIEGTKYVRTNFDITPGIHMISHQNPTRTYFAYLYESTKAEACAYPIGSRKAPINPCTLQQQVGTESDGLDNDCDGKIDEEICFDDVISDQDGDGKYNEDCAPVKLDFLRAVSFIKTSNVVTSKTASIVFTPSTKGPTPTYYNIYVYVTSKGASTRTFLRRMDVKIGTTKFTLTINGLQSETEYTVTVSSRIVDSKARADNSINVKTEKDANMALVAGAASDKTKLQFTLTMDDPKRAYTVEWYNAIQKTTTKIKTIELDVGTTTTLLQQNELTISGYGMAVYAKIYSCKTKPCSTVTISPTMSNIWRAEVKTTTTHLILVEGGKEEQIKLTCSAPPSLLCIKTDGPCVSIRVEAYQLAQKYEFKSWNQQVIHQAVIGQAGKKASDSFCGVEITENTWSTDMVISVKGKVDRMYDGKQDRQFRVEWRQRVQIDSKTLRRTSYKIAEIDVTVADKDKRGFCWAYFRPHLMTFDSSYFYNDNEGEFVLYQHKTLPYAVHVVQKQCKGKQKAACICAVSVKSGDDVIMVDSCNKQKGRMSLTLHQNGKLTPGTKIYNYGFLYKILLPTGGLLTVYPSYKGRYMSVFFRPSTADYGQVKGLCGNFDGDKNNDLQLKDGTFASDSKTYRTLSLLWRVEKKESIISGVCPAVKEDPGIVYCDCAGTPSKDRCDYGLDTRPYDEFLTRSATDKYSADKTASLIQNAKMPRPAIKCGTDEEDEKAYVIRYDYTEITKITITSEWTEVKAKAYCMEYLKKSPAWSFFESQGVPGKLPDRCEIALKFCIRDILDYGTTEWAIYIRESINIIFKFEAMSTIKLWVKETEEIYYPKVLLNVCFKDCSGNGNCKEGICQCNSGFSGIDCSIDNTKPPAIDFVEPLTCDTNKPDSGARISLFGNNFVQSATLMCQMQSVTIDIKKTETIGPVTKTTAIHISRYQVICVAKVCTQFQVAVGNNEATVTAKYQAVTDLSNIKKATLTSSLTIERKREWKCSFGVSGKAENLYTVEWYSGERKIYTNTVDGNQEGKAILTEEKFTAGSSDGAEVQCRVVVCVKTSCGQTKGVVMMSNIYIQEIQVEECLINGTKYERGDFNPANEDAICNPYKNKKAWSQKNMCVSFDFSKVENGKLDVDGMKANIEGSAVVEENIIRLNGKKQFITYDIAKKSCQSDLTLCKKQGLSLVLSFKFKSLKENMYLLSSGGETLHSQGVSVVFKFGQLWFIFNTDTKAWYVPIEGKLDINQLYKFEVHFLESSGIEIYVGGILVKKVTHFEIRKATKKISSKLFIGRASLDTCVQQYADVEIGTTHMCHATREELIKTGIIMGPSTLPPTTTITLPPVPKECKGRPRLAIRPTLLVEFSATVTVMCSVDSLSTSVQYGVQYYLGGKPIQFGWIDEKSKSIALDKSKFTLAKLKGGLFCTLTARYRTVECINTISGAIKSNVYKAELEIKTEGKITIEEGGKEEVIDIYPTASPDVLCGMGGASVEISVVLQRAKRDLKCKRQYLPQTVIRSLRASKGSRQVCGTVLDSASWRVSQKIGIKGFRDFKRDRTQTRIAWLYMKCLVGGRVRTTRKIRSIEITVKDVHRQPVCKAVGDPHLRTFDGQRFNVYLVGEFIMYKHDTKQNIVHAFFKKCGKASCNCGVAVRCGDDVVVIDYCQSRRARPRSTSQLNIQMFKNGDISPGFNVYELNSGLIYEIHLPSGTYVKAKIRRRKRGKKRSYVMDLYLYASASDYRQTSGLCGRFDGSRKNDLESPEGKRYSRRKFPNDFSKTWRAKESLYNGVEASQVTASRVESASYCQCIGTGSQVENRCGQLYDMNNCDRTFGIMKGKLITNSIITSTRRFSVRGRKKRATEEPKPFAYDPNYAPPDTVWPTASGITKEQARQICTDGIANNSAIQACSKKAPTDFSGSIEDCIEDIGAADDKSWVESALGTVTENCQNEALTDTSLFTTDANGDLQPPQDLIQAVCPNNCGNQGICTNGTCTCDPGFVGDDCTLTDGPPEVTEFQDDGVCDTQTDSCTSVIVIGDNFNSNDLLTCHMEETEIGTGKRKAGVKTAKAIYISMEQVVCTLPKVAPYYIKVSNDGKKTSPELLHLVVDSTCHTCSSADKCQLTKTGCLIGGRCYKDGTVDPGYRCNICNGKTDNTGWTRRDDEGCELPYKKGISVQTIIIIVAVFFVCLVLAISIIVCCARKFIVKKQAGSTGVGNGNTLSGNSLNDSNHRLTAKAWKAEYREGLNAPGGINPAARI